MPDHITYERSARAPTELATPPKALLKPSLRLKVPLKALFKRDRPVDSASTRIWFSYGANDGIAPGTTGYMIEGKHRRSFVIDRVNDEHCWAVVDVPFERLRTKGNAVIGDGRLPKG